MKETRFHSEPPALKGQQESTFYLTVLTWYIRLGCCRVGLRYGIFLDSITSLTGYYYGEQGWCGDDRLFTVLLFSVRSSRSIALRYGLPYCMSVKTT